MTVSSTTTKNSYSGNGSNDTFAYGFKIFDDDDITVIIRTDATGTETVKTKTTHYTVTNVGNTNGGNVVFTSGNIPASGETVVLRRTSAQTQATDYVANDPFPAATHEDALDKLTFLAQEQQEELDRAIKISRTNTMTSTEFTVGATDRANKILAFDSSGEIQVTQEIGTFRGNWAASTAYEVRDLVKDTSTNNIFIVNAAHTSSGAQPLTTNANSAKYDLIVDAATATTSATAAASSATAAASSATAAANSESAASTSETNAATSATNAATSETNAGNSATSAASSATSATASASTATTKASEASTSATNAATSATAAAASETAAAASETAAGTSETNAGNSATTATTKASEAATSATNAATSATTATTKASEASTSATNAATSATAAAASQTAAAASAASAASAFDNFDDTYLGSKTSNPTVDNDGDALVAGALYFNSTANEMRVYDGANWIAATSAGNVSLILYEYTATSGQTTFSGSDDNSATLSYTVDNLQVVMNGVILDPSDYTATNGTSVVLASGAATNDLVNIYAFKSFTTADMVSASAGGTFAGAVGFSGGATFPDSAELVFGTGSDFKISHNGSKTKIEDTGTGNLEIRGTNIEFYSGDGGETLAKLTDDGAAELYHNNTKRIETSSTGVDVTGLVKTSNAYQVWLGANVLGSNGGLTSIGANPIVIGTDGTERLRIDSSGNVGIGTIPSKPLHVSLPTGSGATPRATAVAVIDGNDNTQLDILGGTGSILGINFGDSSDNDQARITCNTTSGSENMAFTVDAAERMRIANNRVSLFKNNNNFATPGFEFDSDGQARFTNNDASLLNVNRVDNDGTLMQFHQGGTEEGSISVSGTTVSYNGGHLARWSQLADNTKDTSIVKGTVMTNLDQMSVWHHEAQAATYYTEGDELPDGVSVGDEKTPAVAAYDEDNEQLNCMAVSSVEGDANVAGVFVNWDDDDTDFTADMNVAMTGDMVIRIASGTTVARGDLLMSAGDGTAKPQGDDIVRSKTIAKVTSTTVSHTYDDGTFLVPCVLMAC